MGFHGTYWTGQLPYSCTASIMYIHTTAHLQNNMFGSIGNISLSKLFKSSETGWHYLLTELMPVLSLSAE